MLISFANLILFAIFPELLPFTDDIFTQEYLIRRTGLRDSFVLEKAQPGGRERLRVNISRRFNLTL